MRHSQHTIEQRVVVVVVLFFTLDTVRSVISCSKARVSSACFWLCSAIFSLNFLGLEPPVPGELDMVRGRASTISVEGSGKGAGGSWGKETTGDGAARVEFYSAASLGEAMRGVVWESKAHISNGGRKSFPAAVKRQSSVSPVNG